MKIKQLRKTEIFQIDHKDEPIFIHVELVYYDGRLTESRIKPPSQEDFGFYNSLPYKVRIISELLSDAATLIEDKSDVAAAEAVKDEPLEECDVNFES